jgi:hypothetical protein
VLKLCAKTYTFWVHRDYLLEALRYVEAATEIKFIEPVSYLLLYPTNLLSLYYSITPQKCFLLNCSLPNIVFWISFLHNVCTVHFYRMAPTHSALHSVIFVVLLLGSSDQKLVTLRSHPLIRLCLMNCNNRLTKAH